MALTMPVACIVHLDVDAFFASIEQRDDPALRGQPVAVGTGVVASSSYEAKRQGVRTGMSLAEARARCRGLRIVPGDYRRYEQAGHRILAICLERTPRVEMAALDDLYLDLTEAIALRDDPIAECHRLGSALRQQVGNEVGLSVSLGIARNRLTAAVAAEQAKKRPLDPRRDGLSALLNSDGAIVVVPAGSEADYLAPWPIEILPGVGRRFLEQLQRLNLTYVHEVAAMPLAALVSLFGERGRLLYSHAHGIDHRSVQPYRPPQSVSRCTSFDPPSGDPLFCLAMLDHLLDRALSWLRVHNLAARGLSITLRYGDYQTAEGRTAFRRPVTDETTLRQEARDRYHRVLTRRLPLRLLGIALSPLVAPVVQPLLFTEDTVQRNQRLTECKDAIRQRFGFMALRPASALTLDEKLKHDRDNYQLRTPCLTR